MNWQRLRYTLYAPLYDRVVQRFESGRRTSIEGLHFRARDKILLVGAGTGLDLPYLPKHVDTTATDINPTMLSYLVQRSEGQSIPVQVAVMDGRTLALADNTYDVVLLHLILAVMPDPLQGIQEAVRVLKPGGTLAIFDKFASLEEVSSWRRRLLNTFIGAIATDINRQVEPLLGAVSVGVSQDRVLLSVAGVHYRSIYATKQSDATLAASG